MRLAALLLGATALAVSSQAPAFQEEQRPANASLAENRAVYIQMPDGVKIAADIWLPPARQSDGKLPSLVSFTRYWRARELNPPAVDIDEPIKTMVSAGFAVIIADTRGSGASFGTRGAEFSPCETRDFKFVVDWIAAQPWSNGRVAAIGISYTGNTAEHATYDPSPALVAAAPRFTDFDAYASILFPGGLRNALITDEWATAVHALDNNTAPNGNWRSRGPRGERLIGVKPVDSDRDRRQLQLAVAEHAANQDFFAALSAADFRDDLHLTGDLSSACDRIVTPYLLLAHKPARHIPTYHWASWMDAGTAAGVLARFVDDPKGFYIIGPWSHAAEFDAEVFNAEDEPVAPDVATQYATLFDFLAPPLAAPTRHNSPPRAGLEYYTMGERLWKHTTVWPPIGSVSQKWFLTSEKALRQSAPGAGEGSDRYDVDFNAGSGDKSRWTTQLGGSDVYYGDRRGADALLLTYTSSPLERETEITGSPLVQLYVASTHEDGAIIAYLEAVAPTGAVTMITEGELRLIHRRVSPRRPPYESFGPYHSFERQDAQPMVPGEIAEISFALLPTSIRLPRGYSLRLAIAGHDKDSFSRYPAQGNPTLRIFRDRAHPSSLTLPVIERATRKSTVH